MSRSKLSPGKYRVTFTNTSGRLCEGISFFDYAQVANTIRKSPLCSALLIDRILRRQITLKQRVSIYRKLRQEGRIIGLIPNPDAPKIRIKYTKIDPESSAAVARG